MRRMLAVVVMVAVTGCGDQDPESSRLEAGQVCMVIATRSLAQRLPGGTRVQVESDDEEADTGRVGQFAADLARDAGLSYRPNPKAIRKVRVLILDGEKRGSIQDVERYFLRPLPR